MTRPISARTRADAIAICEQRHDPGNDRFMVSDLADHLGANGKGGRAYHLAFNAWREVWSVKPTVNAWLEASGLLRDGWRPGDPVEVRK